jgi:hypothetical protein
MLGGTLAAFMTACIAGQLLEGSAVMSVAPLGP